MAAQDNQVAIVAESAVVSFSKPRNSAHTNKIIKGIGSKTIEEAMVETEARKQAAIEEHQEALAAEKMHATQAEEATTELEQVQKEIDAKIAEELDSVVQFRELKQKQLTLGATTNASRGKLFEAQKKLAMLEIFVANRSKTQAIEEKYRAAAKAAEEATKKLSAEKRLQKQSLKDTSRIWNEKQCHEATRNAFENLDKKSCKRGSRATAVDEVDEPPSKRPLLKAGETEKQELEPECAPTIVQSLVKSLVVAREEETTCTLLDDAQDAQLPSSI